MMNADDIQELRDHYDVSLKRAKVLLRLADGDTELAKAYAARDFLDVLAEEIIKLKERG